MFKIIKSLVCS